MKHFREKGEIDPRIHSVLDGETSSSNTAAFEEDLRSGNASRGLLETFEHLGAWLRSTRSRAPSNLFREVENRIQGDLPSTDRPASPPWWKRFQTRPVLRWGWAPAAAALAAVLVLSIEPGRVEDPSDGLSPPSEHAASPMKSATSGNDGYPTPERVRYVFRVEAGSAKEVCLAGDFNKWRVCEAPLERVGEEVWSITVDLPPGRHEYMFVIDGQWVTDPHAMGYSEDGFGNKNAIVVV